MPSIAVCSPAHAKYVLMLSIYLCFAHNTMQVNMDELGADIAKYRRKEAESSTGDDGGGFGNGLKVSVSHSLCITS
jgi:hypothetical protein